MELCKSDIVQKLTCGATGEVVVGSLWMLMFTPSR